MPEPPVSWPCKHLPLSDQWPPDLLALLDRALSGSEIKDAPVIFETVWRKLQKKYGDEKLWYAALPASNARALPRARAPVRAEPMGLSAGSLPAEIIWLMGAPGSGKGTNTPFIQKARGITSPPIIMSSLLQSPEMRALIDGGVMISAWPHPRARMGKTESGRG